MAGQVRTAAVKTGPSQSCLFTNRLGDSGLFKKKKSLKNEFGTEKSRANQD